MTTRMDWRALALASALIALGAGGAAAQIKIGSVLSVTGPASFLGDPEKKTLEMYVEEINAKGGVNGQKLQLIVYDDTGDANQARTFATRLVEDDKVVAIVGGSTTGPTMAMVPVAEDAQIPFISLAGATVIIEPVKKWVFKTPHSDKMACEKIYQDMKRRGLTTLGLFSSNDGFGKSMREGCLQTAKDFGVEVVADEVHGPNDTDMTPQLTNIKAKGVQAVAHTGFGRHAAVAIRNYRQLGLDMPYYENHGVASKTFIELSGGAADGIRLPAPALVVADKLPDADPQKQVVTAYKASFEKKTGQPVSAFGGFAYDGLMILVQAMERAKSSDPAKVRDEIEKTKGYIGTSGIVTMSPKDHMGLDLTAFKMLEIKNGDWVMLPESGS